MRCVVTGGAGFIGSHLVEGLTRAGNEVLVVDDLSSGVSRVSVVEAAGVRVDTSDIRDSDVQKVILGFQPQVIFHLAAQMDVRRSVADPIFDAAVNVLGTLNILEAARSAGARVVFASSGGTIYGEPDLASLPIKEGTVGRPTSPYGITKKVADDYLRFYEEIQGVPFVSLAMANVYGPRQDPHGEAGVIAIFALKLLDREPCLIFGDGKQTRDFVYVGDVVKAFIAAIDRGDGETINIGTGVETDILTLHSKMAEICGVDSDPTFAPERPGELLRISLDTAKAEELLGWVPAVGLDQGLTETIADFEQE